MNQKDRKLYEEMIGGFGMSLEKVSCGNDNCVCVTDSQHIVVNFDEFKKTICQSAKSCDVFCVTGENDNWFLIEFKNGQVNRTDIYLKILESLLLLMLHFGKDLQFVRDNVHVVLVYNKIQCSRKSIMGALAKLERKHLMKFLPVHFEGLYCHKVAEYEQEQFDVFLQKYGFE